MRQKNGHLYEFGPFTLDPAQHLLSRHGDPVPMTPKTFDMLLLLVENRGRMLTKDELMKALWPDSFVDESNLTQQISMIRKALGETAGERRYIATVPGRGYRFAAEVKGVTVEPDVVVEVPPPPPEPEPGPEPPKVDAFPVIAPTPSRWHKQALLPAIALVTLGLLTLGYAAYQNQVQKRRDVPSRTLAILPFQSIREDPTNEFLGFSLADAVITKLDYVRSITVRPSSAIEKYRNKTIEIPKIAGDLHVDTILTGNFVREGDDLRITSQLIDVKTQNILWKGTFDVKYDRLLTVQDRVSQELIKGLKLSLSPQEVERLKPDAPINPMAYEYYLRGADLYSRNDFPLAIKMLEKSAQMDSRYALTWANLGRAHTANASFELGGRAEYLAAQAAYEKALALNPSLIEAKIYMANRFTDTGRVESAVPLLREAEKTSPNHAEVHWELGYAYRFAGMLHESVAECERARRIDPSVKLSTSALNGYLYVGEYDKFLESLPKTTNSALILFYKGFGKYHERNFEQAAKDFDAAFDLHPTLLQARVGKALSFAVRNQNAKAHDILQETENTISERGVGDPEAIYKIAQGYAVIGEKASALRVLRHSVENGFFSYPYIATDPLLNNIRAEGEFNKIASVARERHERFKQKFF